MIRTDRGKGAVTKDLDCVGDERAVCSLNEECATMYIILVT